MVAKWRSSIRPDLMRSVLLRGSVLGGAGAILVVIAGAMLPIVYLKVWGLPILFTALLFITIGLLPYRRLTKLEASPNELHCDGESLFFIQKGNPMLRIPLSALDNASYHEMHPLYGLCLKFKTTPTEKVTVLNPRFDMERLITESRAHFPECDLFFTYFSERSCKEFEDLFQGVD